MADAKQLCTLKLMVVIVDRPQTKKVMDILYKKHVRVHFICLAEGTAGSDLLAVLGLDSSNKSFICCLEPEYRIPPLLAMLSESLQLRKPGKGIAFTVPLTGVNQSVVQLLMKDCGCEADEREDEKLETVKTAPKFDLILSVVNQGYVDALMEAAKAAGARGGTVLHGRKVGVEDDAKFLGIAAQLEKEIVAILTTHEKKNDIMRAITQAFGMNTEARGIIFSLPVEDIEGLGGMKEVQEVLDAKAAEEKR